MWLTWGLSLSSFVICTWAVRSVHQNEMRHIFCLNNTKWCHDLKEKKKICLVVKVFTVLFSTPWGCFLLLRAFTAGLQIAYVKRKKAAIHWLQWGFYGRPHWWCVCYSELIYTPRPLSLFVPRFHSLYTASLLRLKYPKNIYRHFDSAVINCILAWRYRDTAS